MEMLEKMLKMFKKTPKPRELLYIVSVIENGRSVYIGENKPHHQLKGYDMINVMQLKRMDAIRRSKLEAKRESLVQKPFSNYRYIMLERICEQLNNTPAPIQHYIVPPRLYKRGQVLESLPKEAVDLELYLSRN
jgi:hypothetical protein